MSEKSEKFNNFIRDYLTENKGKITSEFIKDYLGTGATIEVFIYRELNSKLSREFPKLSEEEIGKKIEEILGQDTYDRINKVLNVYNNGIEGQDVSDCDFSALSQEDFEMLRFDESTIFSQETSKNFQTEEILSRRNTQIENQQTNGTKIHIAIIDVDGSIDNDYHGGTAKSIFCSINPNCEVHFYGVGSEDQDRAKAVEDINDYNERCEDESKKIKLISCSHDLGDSEKELIEEGNLKVISASNLHGNFFEYFRFDGTDVIPSLTEKERKFLRERYSNPDVSPIAERFIETVDKYINKAVLVNVNLAIDKPIKRHECDISISWGVPVVAAYYAMALSANPDMKYGEFYNICKKNSLKEKTNIFDEKKFMGKIEAIKQEKTTDCQTKKRSLLEDYPEAIEGSTDLSYRLDSINETTKEIKSDLAREEEQEQNNDDPNIE